MTKLVMTLGPREWVIYYFNPHYPSGWDETQVGVGFPIISPSQCDHYNSDGAETVKEMFLNFVFNRSYTTRKYMFRIFS